MKTRVFISWSGNLSKAVAEVLRAKLPAALQNVAPFFSPDDIQKGQRWSSELAAELESSSVGIICITKENRNAPWLLYESGALSKHLSHTRLCTLLIDLKPTDLSGPLAQFQHSSFDRGDFKKLFETINSANTQFALQADVLETVFDQWWPSIDDDLAKALKQKQPSVQGTMRSDREILEELLNLQRRADSNVFQHTRSFLEIQSELEYIAIQLLVLLNTKPIESRLEFRSVFSLLADVLAKFPNTDEVRKHCIQALNTAAET